MSLADTTTKVQAMASNADPLGSSLKFSFNDDKGTIYLDGTGAQNVVSNEDKEAACTVNIALDDFNAMIKGELDAMTAFMEQKITLEGDMSVAMQLQSLFS